MRRFFSENKYGGGKKQYMSAVWARDEAQAAIASRVAKEQHSSVPVLGRAEWWDAEEYHRIASSARTWVSPPLPPRPQLD